VKLCDQKKNKTSSTEQQHSQHARKKKLKSGALHAQFLSSAFSMQPSISLLAGLDFRIFFHDFQK
jgi:hypothetical protein